MLKRNKQIAENIENSEDQNIAGIIEAVKML